MNTRAMSDKLQDWGQRAGERVRTVSQVTDDYVRENAWSTVVLATLVGYLLGYLTARRED